MTQATIPQGYTTIIGKDTAGLMNFLTRAFGAQDLGRMEVAGRIAHAEMRIGSGVVMMFDAPDEWPRTPASSASTSRTPNECLTRRCGKVPSQ